MIRTLRSRLLFSAFITLLSSQAVAVSCYEKSPDYTKQGEEKYYNLTDSKPLTRKQHKSIKQFFSPFLNSRLEGSNVLTDCIGPEKSAKKKLTKEKLKAKMSLLSSGELALELDIENPAKNTTRNETIRYFTDDRVYVIKSIDKNRIVVQSKQRISRPIRMGRIGTLFIEDLIVFKRNGDTLDITTTRYHFGHFAVEFKRTLHK